MSKLLIIDDEETGQRAEIIDAAKSAGIAVRDLVTPNSWEEAERAIQQSFPVAVIDINLSYWGGRSEGGIEMIRRLVERHPGCKVIALTRTRGNLEDRALEAGAGKFIFSGSPDRPWKPDLKQVLSVQPDLTAQTT